MRKKVGLALGAGSSKGFAHIGVLQALDEAGIQIDMISGSSMGAIIGGIYSVGTDLYMLEKSTRSTAVKPPKLLVRPRVSRNTGSASFLPGAWSPLTG